MRILSHPVIAAFNLLLIASLTGKEMDEDARLRFEAHQNHMQSVKMAEARRLFVDYKLGEVLVINDDRLAPERFIEVFEYNAGGTAYTVNAKIDFGSEAMTDEILGMFATILFGLSTSVSQFASDGVSEQLNRTWDQYYFEGRESEEHGLTFRGFNVGRISVQPSLGGKFAVLIDETIFFVDYSAYAEYAKNPTQKLLSAMIGMIGTSSVKIGPGFFLMRTYGKVAALATNGETQKIVTADMKVESFDTMADDSVGQPIYVMSAIDETGKPTKRFTTITETEHGLDVEIDTDLRETPSTPLFVRLAELTGKHDDGAHV